LLSQGQTHGTPSHEFLEGRGGGVKSKPKDQMKAKDNQETLPYTRDKHHIFHATLASTASTRRTSHHNNFSSSIHGNLLPPSAHISSLFSLIFVDLQLVAAFHPHFMLQSKLLKLWLIFHQQCHQLNTPLSSSISFLYHLVILCFINLLKLCLVFLLVIIIPCNFT
jgi:hypothetical protein